MKFYLIILFQLKCQTTEPYRWLFTKRRRFQVYKHNVIKNWINLHLIFLAISQQQRSSPGLSLSSVLCQVQVRCHLVKMRETHCKISSIGGRRVFREFLRCEYSEENILFWLACEDLKKENNPEKIEEKARMIYEDYVSILSPREVRGQNPFV